MVGAVILDFDGVIADSEALHLRAINQVISKFNVQITKEDYYQNYLGLNDFDFFDLLINSGQLKVGIDQMDTLMKQKSQLFEKMAKNEGSIISGVRQFISRLKESNIPMAICSGALLSEIKMMLADSQLEVFFETIVSAEHVAKGKPFPEGFLLALERLNEKLATPIHASQCVVIEDSPWGLKAAMAAGMHTVAITNSYEAKHLTMAEKVIDHLDQLDIELINELCS
jgi:beta-phosphoglucomutase